MSKLYWTVSWLVGGLFWNIQRPFFCYSFLQTPPISNPIRSRQSSTFAEFSSPLSAATSQSLPYLQELLNEYGWGNRIVTIAKDTLPVGVEFYQDGSMQVGQLVDWEESVEDSKPPKFCISQNNQEPRLKIDIGQLSTVWSQPIEDDSGVIEIPPRAQVERALDEMYETCQQKHYQSQQRQKTWTKKQLNQILSNGPKDEQPFLDTVLRQAVKAGRNYELLIDSGDVAQALSSDVSSASRAQLASLLSEMGGGRYKRMSCQFMGASKDKVTLLNGGWLAVDRAARAANEARAMAQGESTTSKQSEKRILERLEHLALSGNRRGKSNVPIAPQDLEVDVLEFLNAKKLPLSPAGAKSALVELGIWTHQSDSTSRQEPWSPEVLNAAQWYQQMDQKRKERFREQLKKGDPGESQQLEGRINLTHLPSVCVDAARTSFRDDAMGVRPRAATGRRVSPTSKWEILIHIADTSDLYAPPITSRSLHLEVLRDAAAQRGVSRYDLPSGPLHLLPPTLLDTLALKACVPDFSSKGDVLPMNDATSKSFNRCVTVWVYIDEETGKLLDAGMERTLIVSPIALSFQSATDILDGKEKRLPKIKPLLGVIERNLKLWRSCRQQQNPGVRSREDRLKARELVDQQLYGKDDLQDNGRSGFVRTRGHQLVDLCQEIYGYAVKGMVQRANASLPRVAGTERDGRTASSPLRRYIDGIAQRQALAVLCHFGGEPWTQEECTNIGKGATETINSMRKVDSLKRGRSVSTDNQKEAVQALNEDVRKMGLAELDSISTGKQSQVVLHGYNILATCRGMQGTAPPGSKVRVKIDRIDAKSGAVEVTALNAIQN